MVSLTTVVVAGVYLLACVLRLSVLLNFLSESHPDNVPLVGVLIFRVQSSLVYFNVDHVLDMVRKWAAKQSGGTAA